MGLREEKAARTRRLLIDTALDLFTVEGYDATTMEAVAERAEVGTSTLYRYFPTKDGLLLDPLLASLDVASHLAERPDDEPLDAALAEALVATMRVFDTPELRLRAIRRLVDGAPVPRARLWDSLREARLDLDREVARRLESDASDLAVRLTSGFAMELLHLADEEEKSRPEAAAESSAEATMRRLLAELPGASLTPPRAAERLP